MQPSVAGETQPDTLAFPLQNKGFGLNDTAMERALAIVSLGGSFAEASDSTGLSVEQITTRYYSVQEADHPFVDDSFPDDKGDAGP